MDEGQYREEVLRTYAGPDEPLAQLNLGALGLAGEAGEVVDLIKKALFSGHTLDMAVLGEELGDVFWYSMLLCHVMGCSFSDLMAMNVNKLRQRYPNGFDPERSVNRESYHNDEYCWAHVPGGRDCIQCRELQELGLA